MITVVLVKHIGGVVNGRCHVSLTIKNIIWISK
jgi:hypothetical protein